MWFPTTDKDVTRYKNVCRVRNVKWLKCEHSGSKFLKQTQKYFHFLSPHQVASGKFGCLRFMNFHRLFARVSRSGNDLYAFKRFDGAKHTNFQYNKVLVIIYYKFCWFSSYSLIVIVYHYIYIVFKWYCSAIWFVI